VDFYVSQHPPVAEVTHARARHSMRATFIYASYQAHSLNHPAGIAITPPGGGSGNIYTGLYVVGSANNVIKLVQDSSHTLVTVTGNGTAGYRTNCLPRRSDAV